MGEPFAGVTDVVVTDGNGNVKRVETNKLKEAMRRLDREEADEGSEGSEGEEGGGYAGQMSFLDDTEALAEHVYGVQQAVKSVCESVAGATFGSAAELKTQHDFRYIDANGQLREMRVKIQVGSKPAKVSRR